MNWDHKLSRILITGKSGSGKTSLYLKMIWESKARWKFCFDPDREVSRKLNLPFCRSVAEMEAKVVALQPVCFYPDYLFPGRRADAFAFFCRWVYEICTQLKGVKLATVDEVWKYTRTGQGGVPLAFQELLDASRREEVNMILIAQRLNQVNDAIRGGLTEIITFQHTDRLPLNWLEEDGFDRDQVRALPYPGGYIRRDVNRSEQKTFAPHSEGKRNR